MKGFFKCLVLLIIVSSTALAQTDLSLAEAKRKAQKENKYIYVFYTADWCLPCKMMKEGAFSDQRINHILSKGIIAIQADEDDPKTKSWFKYFDVNAIPLSLILDKDGNVYRRLEGFKSVESVYQMLSEFSAVDASQAQLNVNVKVFNTVTGKRDRVKTSLDIIANNKRIIKSKQTHSVVTETKPPKNSNQSKSSVKEETFRPSLYAIQLNSFKGISDAIEYLDYINLKIDGGAQIFTNESKTYFNVVVEYPSLKDAKDNFAVFKELEANCFIRIL